MVSEEPPLGRVALVWEQFAAYHVDRCEAVANRLAGRMRVQCVEIATSSQRYAWEASGSIAGAEKTTLFSGSRFENIPRRTVWRALYRTLSRAEVVILGISSSDPWNAALAASLRRKGTRVFFCSESKADDYPRSALSERLKRVLLRSYDGGIVAGPRSFAYYRSLGWPAERLWPGYSTVSAERVRRIARHASPPPWEDRPFLFLGRFVPKKAIDALLEAYAKYRGMVDTPRDLVLAGDGPLKPDLLRQAKALGVADHVRWPGFLDAEASVHAIAESVALLLPSREEQWGLVVQEAISAGIPPIVSEQVGSRDLLVEHGVSGSVVADDSVEELAGAMVAIGADEQAWFAMSQAASERTWYGDSERFGASVADIVEHGRSAARPEVERLLAAFG